MNKMKWKNFLTVTIIIALVVGGYFAFSAIYTWREEKRIRDTAVYLVITDNKGNEYTTECAIGTMTLDYEREANPDDPTQVNRLTFSAEIYFRFKEGERPERKFARYFDERIDLATPGEYVTVIEGTSETKHYVRWVLIVNVKENRPLPDMEFDPGADCLEYVFGEEPYFKFKYNGNKHYPPALRISWEGKEIMSISSNSMKYECVDPFEYKDGILIEYDPTTWIKEIGRYKLTINISRDELPENYRYTFKPIEIPVIIEIVE